MGRIISIIGAPEKLNDNHILKKFDCGKSELNTWLQRIALKEHRANSTITIVSCVNNKVIAYYSMSVGSIDHQPEAPQKNIKRFQSSKSRGKKRLQPVKQRVKMSLEQHSIPVMIISRLAVDIKYQRRGIGKGLLQDAILRTLNASEHAGIKLILVHAKDKEASEFYQKFYFEPCPIAPFKLMLLLKNAQNISTSIQSDTLD